MFKWKKMPKHEYFYDGSKGAELVFKARSGSLELLTRTYRWSDSKSKVCPKCINIETFHD